MATLTPGTRFGPYEVVASIGAGGMGEVFRAVDTALGRAVAIKVLPDAFQQDPQRLARFDHEARTLASVSHPNIAQVYGLEQGALVMELLDGRSLREVLADGVLPPRKAVDYATQIARGLAAAHERGIIHRDLKPENIFVLRDGQLKILDFGLARRAPAAGSGATETLAAPGVSTDPGTVMGTAGYMAPEQVRGEAVDPRTDLFALGAVLFEMLTGQRAFRRETGAETMTAVLRDDPPELSAIRADLPPALDRIVRHCLEKNPVERFQTARDVAFALGAWSGSGSASASALPATRPTRLARERWLWAAATAMLALGLAWQVATVPRRATSPAPPVSRSLLLLPAGIDLSTLPFAGLNMTVSPDGTMVAFSGVNVGDRKTFVWIYSLRDGSARRVAGSEGGFGLFWSPDSRHLAFTGGPGGIKRVDVVSNTVSPIIASMGVGTWNARDDILFVSRPPIRSLQRTTVSGARPVEVRAADAADRSHLYPAFLSDGRRYLFGYRDLRNQAVSGTYLGELDSDRSTLLLARTDSFNAFVAQGHLVFARGDAVFAQPFDESRLAFTGEATRIVSGVSSDPGVAATFTVSSNGVLVYAPAVDRGRSRLQWFNRAGRLLSTVGGEAEYSNVRLSPDGRRVAVSAIDPAARTRDIYVIDLARGVRQRLTFDASDERSAVWSPDGRQIVYNSKGLDLYARPSDFTGSEVAVQTDKASKDPQGFMPDGRHIIYRRSGEHSGNDIWMMDRDAGTAVALLQTPFSENYAEASPDGRSLVYVSDESGREEVYVLSLDGGGKSQISSDGGSFPRWRRDGREIVYLAPGNRFMSVTVGRSRATFEAGVPQHLFDLEVLPGPGVPFDLSSDGARLLVNTPIPSTAPRSLGLIVNWPLLVQK